jgi:hypothetical protein
MRTVKVEFMLTNGEVVTFENKDNGQGFQIEFNVFISPLHTTNNNSWLKIENPEVKYLANKFPLTNAHVKIYAGMKKSFKWITQTYGLIGEGMVWQEMPNTESINNYLYVNLVNQSSVNGVNSVEIINSAKDTQLYYRLDWDDKTELKDALLNCFKRFHPLNKIDIKINTGYLGLQYNNSLPFENLESLAYQVYRLSNEKITMTADNGIIVVRDDTTVNKPKVKIGIQDIIGQPNIIDVAGSLNIKTHLNGKIAWNDIVEIPQNAIASLSPDAARSQRNRLNFTGDFKVVGVQHICSVRSKNADDFSSILTLQPV